MRRHGMKIREVNNAPRAARSSRSFLRGSNECSAIFVRFREVRL